MDDGSGSLMELLETILGTALTSRLREAANIADKSTLEDQFMEVFSGDRLAEDLRRQFCRTLIDELRGDHDTDEVCIPSPKDVGYPSPLQHIVNRINSHDWAQEPVLVLNLSDYARPLTLQEVERLKKKGWNYSTSSIGEVTIKACKC